MSNGSKFWGRHASGNNRVITREYGDISGITKAYDVFVDIPLETMQAATAARADEFCRLLETIGGSKEWKNHPIHYTDVTLSPITNPSARVRNTWDWDYQG
jgi:hypothetical protein